MADDDANLDDVPSIGTTASPSLGYLDEALSFIAAERERARWSALHGIGTGVGLGFREEGEWMHVIGIYFPVFLFLFLLFGTQHLKHAELNRANDPPEEAQGTQAGSCA